MGNCRFCSMPLEHTFLDLGNSPLANAYRTKDDLLRMEPFYPLHVYVCAKCFLVQLEEIETPQQIFSHYLYFSSFSSDWLAHAEKYVDGITERLRLNTNSKVIEIASNDGYLLQYFLRKGIPVLGVDPARNVAEAAIARGIATEVAFFGKDTAKILAQQGHTADLMIANNVLAHVPNINDFVSGFSLVLKPTGVITFEFPHLLQLMELNQFDTIYHEHYSYLSLLFVEKLFTAHGLRVFTVEEIPTHGGSLRVYACHSNSDHAEQASLSVVRAKEKKLGLDLIETYRGFGDKVLTTKEAFLAFITEVRRSGKKIVAYGAPAKGNTFLNYCGIKSDTIPFTVDRSPHKQGLFLPGTRIPIRSPQDLLDSKPDYVLILPWNLRSEVAAQLSEIRSWHGKFVVAIPSVEVF